MNEAPRSKLRGILRNSPKPLPSFAMATKGSPRLHPRSSLLRRSSHFGYEGRKLQGIRRRRIIWARACGKMRVPSIIPADRFVQKYAARTAKSVQIGAHSRHMPIWTLNNDATATHENTVTARHPSASRLGRCHPMMRLQGEGFPQYIGTKGAHDVTVLL